MKQFLVAIACLGLVSVPFAQETAKTDAPKFSAEQLAFYERDVLPLLKTHCYECHSTGKVKANLRLTSRSAILAGGDLGSAVNLEEPTKSTLLKAIHYSGKLQMPPKGKLPAKEIDILTRWVTAGLPMPPGDARVEGPKHKGGVVTEESKNYWAYKPVQRPNSPKVTDANWGRNPIDAFILAKLEEKQLAPAAPADRVALIRRVTYDLIGLPPTPEEVDAFVKDTSANAYEKLIDRLLASQHYGEKWGRHWLDLMRYAETNGYERDGPKPFAWRFRDYVIKSFNNDKPYDRFVKELLAGDEIDPENADAIIATGFYRLGLWDDEPVDARQALFDEYDDIVATTSQVFLGMTMNCARCHDHKIDPIPQADYYRMLAFFRDVQRYSNNRDTRSSFNLSDITPIEKRKIYEEELKKREERKKTIQDRMTKIEDIAIKKMSAEDQRAAEGVDRPAVVRKIKPLLTPEQDKEYTALKNDLTALNKVPDPPGREQALSVNHCRVNPEQTHVLIRGGAHNQGAAVEPGFPKVLSVPDPKIPPPAKNARTSGRRSVLANWIVAKDNPLTARVMVNRLWHYHFGRGIATSTSDFGKFGTLPTHPELLDWLASEFMNPTNKEEQPWSIKRMHKLIMMSSTYQMSSRAQEKAIKADPGNMLWWRFDMRRLSAEEVRDTLLTVGGNLNLKMAGPSIYPPIPREVLAGQSVPGQGWPTSSPEESNRRSVYVHIKRSLLLPILSQHDQADTDSSCPVRYTTTVPTQSLGMLNGEFANAQATAFAQRLKKEAPTNLDAQVRRGIRLTTGRIPTDAEVKADLALIQELQTKHRLDEAKALRQYCLLLLNTNELVYLD